MIAAFSVVYITTYNSIKSENERRLDEVTGTPKVTVFESIQGGLTEVEFSSVNRVVISDFSTSFVLTVNERGELVFVDSFLDIPVEQYMAAGKSAWEQLKKSDSSTVQFAERTWLYKKTHERSGELISRSYVGFFGQETLNFSRIAFLDITESQRTLNSLLLTLFFVGIAMLLVIFVISCVFANRSIRPISQSWDKQRQFVADASHELKTPLTTIMTNCDVLSANEHESVGSQSEWLDSIKIGVNRMSRLINNLLTLARAEGIPVQVKKQPFDMNLSVDEVVKSFEDSALFRSKSLRVIRDTVLPAPVCGYEDYVRQVLVILCENAVKYTDENGVIWVSVYVHKNNVVCSVKNTGAGIAARDLPNIFDRFYRSDSARCIESSEQDGQGSYGLGLSIAKSIAESLNGKITVKSAENQMTEFVFSFPA
jgi:signal transduction histidine kinase